MLSFSGGVKIVYILFKRSTCACIIYVKIFVIITFLSTIYSCQRYSDDIYVLDIISLTYFNSVTLMSCSSSFVICNLLKHSLSQTHVDILGIQNINIDIVYL